MFGKSERQQRFADQIKGALGAALIGMAVAVFLAEVQNGGATAPLVADTLEKILQGLEAIEEATS